MRRYGIEKPYEKLKTAYWQARRRRRHEAVYDGLALPEEEKARLKAMTPANYIGRSYHLRS
ncbi:hypothetical protein ACLB1S_12800 [Escherichia coli]